MTRCWTAQLACIVSGVDAVSAFGQSPCCTIAAGRTSSVIRLDGRLDETAWQGAHRLDLILVVEPHSPERTSSREIPLDLP